MTRGEAMHQARLRAGLTIIALLSESGVNRTTISMLEKDKAMGTITTIELLADALGISIDEYIGHKVAKRMTETDRFFYR